MATIDDPHDEMTARTTVFVVRIWNEPDRSRPGLNRWRGMVEHLASRTRGYAETDEELIALIRYWRDVDLFAGASAEAARPSTNGRSHDD